MSGEDREVAVHHHDLEVQAISINGHDLQVATDLFIGVGSRHRVQIVLEQLEQRVPFLGRRVEAAKRPDGLRQVGTEAQDPLPDVDRLVGVLGPLLGRARHLDAHLHPPLDIGLGLLRLGQDSEQLGGLVPGRVVLAVELHHHVVRGVELAHAAEEGLGHVRLPEPLPEQRGQLPDETGVLLAAPGPGRRLQDLAELRPGAGRGEGLAHGPERPRLDRVRLEGLAEVGERVGGPPRSLAQLAGRYLGQRLFVAAGRPLGPLRVDRQQLVGASRLAQHPLEVAPRPPVVGIELEALAQVRLALGPG